MQITIEVPDEIAESLTADDSSPLERQILEAVAAETVRSGRLSRGQARRLLGFETRYEVDALMKKYCVPIVDSFEEVKRDSETALAFLRK